MTQISNSQPQFHQKYIFLAFLTRGKIKVAYSCQQLKHWAKHDKASNFSFSGDEQSPKITLVHFQIRPKIMFPKQEAHRKVALKT